MALLLGDEDMPLDAFYAGGPKTFAEAFPPVCLKSHWDPTQVQRRILPNAPPAAPPVFDPRPHAQICRQYYSESPVANQPAPEHADPSMPMPSAFVAPPDTTTRPTPPGGSAEYGAPFALFRPDAESDLLRLDERLTKCKELRYQPTANALVEDQTNLVPHDGGQAVSEYPEYATVVQKVAGCRDADDDAAWNRSARLFFNHTKLDRYHPDAMNGPLACRPANQYK